jgi:hypothetical protein
MFHVELRMGQQVARQFNMSGPELDRTFLARLMADREFPYAGHDWNPRKLRITILEGPELQPYELSIGGLGWGNAERTGTDVTSSILARAREAAG